MKVFQKSWTSAILQECQLLFADKHAMQIFILPVTEVNFLALEHHWLYTSTVLATGPIKSINCTALRHCFDALFSYKKFN